MSYLKGVSIGFGSVVLGTPIAWMIWAISKSQRGATTVPFSPWGLANHFAFRELLGSDHCAVRCRLRAFYVFQEEMN